MKDAVSVKKYSFILLFYITFIFIFLSNILGMLPYSMTITSHLVLTLYFSLAFFIGSNIIGICYHKQAFFVLFLPEGVPLPIVPFLILIEYVSYISRIFSLAIRLFANMLSGHILLKILISFVWASVSSNMVHWLWSILPMSIVFGVIGLEVSIAFLQAYVFIVLITIYLKDLVHTH
jgi:ATP synthase subunit 6